MSAAAQGNRRAAHAGELLAGFVSSSPELREAAIFDTSGSQLFATDDHDWTAAAAGLWEAAGPADAALTQLHIGTADGEVLAVRGPTGSAIALSDRFPLASLVFSDLRVVLRELGRAEAKAG